MNIAGLIKSSLIDFPDKIAAVIFTQGCNFRCGFCHNPELLPFLDTPLMTEEEVFGFLEKRLGKLDGAVISGGEPTTQPDLDIFVEKIKILGYILKLDTNGSNPKVLEKLFAKNLIDYIAMDIKGDLDQYRNICGFKNYKSILESINLIIASGIDYEFRTTVLPYYHKIDDFEKIGRLINGSKKYVIQGFRKGIVQNPKTNLSGQFTMDELEQIKKIMQKYVKKVDIRSNL